MGNRAAQRQGALEMPFSYGFGWVVDQERGHRAVFHSGGTPGFSSAIRYYPDDGVTVIVLANHGDRILDHIPLDIAGRVLPGAHDVLRYHAIVGEAQLWFSFTLTAKNQIA
jgi:CubicO group peptidase (beta-lactamase class C family)